MTKPLTAEERANKIADALVAIEYAEWRILIADEIRQVQREILERVCRMECYLCQAGVAYTDKDEHGKMLNCQARKIRKLMEELKAEGGT